MALPTSTELKDRLFETADRARRVREAVSKRAAIEAGTDIDVARGSADIARPNPLVGSPPQR
jgi:hypothetical protein